MPEYSLSPELTKALGTTSDTTLNDFQQNVQEGLDRVPRMSDNLRKYLQFNGIGIPDTNQNTPKTTTDILRDFERTPGLPADPFRTLKQMNVDLRNPNKPNQFIDRYDALDRPDLAFSPLRNNEDYYNQYTDGWDDFQRAAAQWATLTNIGLIDSLGIGDLDRLVTGEYADTPMARAYNRANVIGSSSRGGVSGFMNNLFLNSGYTVGILEELALEELAMFAAEAGLQALAPVTGGASEAAAIPLLGLMGFRFTRATNKIADAFNIGKKLTKTLDDLKDVSTARRFFNKGLDFINPLENTIDFAKNAKSMTDVSSTVKAYRGFASMYRDIRNVKAAFSESSLEAGMVENEMREDLMTKFYEENGRYPNDIEASRLNLVAKGAGTKTALMNMPLIYFSNKLTFGGLNRGPFKSMYSDVLDAGLGRKIAYDSSKKLYEAVPETFLAKQKYLLQNPKILVGNALKYSTDNVTEGLQEVGQDIISDVNKSYYGDLYNGDAIRGGYYNYLMSSIDKQVSAQGLETFLSGFLMQTMVGPLANTMNVIKNGRSSAQGNLAGEVGEYIQDRAKRFTSSPEAYQEYKTKKTELKADRRERLDKIVKELNDTIDIKTYLSKELENLQIQSQLEPSLQEAERAGDKKKYHDLKDNAFFKAMTTSLSMGRFDDVMDVLEDYKKLSPEEVKADFNQDYETYTKAIDKAMDGAKRIQSRWNYYTNKYKNPFNPYQFKKGTDQYNETFEKHIAWKNATEEAIFNHYTFDQALKRQTDILNSLKDVTGLEKTPYSSINILADTKTLEAELTSLELEIGNGKQNAKGVLNATEAFTDELKATIKEKQEKYNLLKQFSEKLEALKSNESDEVYTEADYKALKKVYAQYLSHLSKTSDDYLNNDKVEESFKALVDYHTLKGRSHTANDAVNVLLDPNNFTTAFKRNYDIVKHLVDNKEAEIRKSYEAFSKLQVNDALQKELLGIGVFITESDLKNLDEKKVAPTAFYKSEFKDGSHEQIAWNNPLHQKALDILKKFYPDLINIPIGNASPSAYSLSNRRKSASDTRTYEELAKEFGFDDKEQVPLKQVLKAVIDSQFSSEREKELARKLLPLVRDGEFVTFSNSESVPGSFSIESTRQSVIDARYVSFDYQNDNLPIEVLILRNEIARRVAQSLETDEVFKKQATDLMNRTLAAYKKLSNEEMLQISTRKIEDGVFTDVKIFVSEGLTNPAFQTLLAKVDSGETVETKNSWKQFVDMVLKVFEKILVRPNGTVLNALMEVVTTQIEKEFGSGITGGTTQEVIIETTPGKTTTGKGKKSGKKPIPEATEKKTVVDAVSDEEWNNYDKNNVVSQVRLVTIANKLDEGSELSKREKVMMEADEVKERVRVVQDRRVTEPPKILSASTKQKLIDLGFVDLRDYNGAKITPAMSMIILAEGLTKSERETMYFNQNAELQKTQTLEKLHEHLIAPMLIVNDPDDLKDLQFYALTYAKDNIDELVESGFQVSEIDEAYAKRLNELKNMTDFDKIVVGTIIILKDGKKVRILAKNKDSMEIEYLENGVTETMTRSEAESKVEKIYTRANELAQEDYIEEDVPKISPEDAEISNESMKGLENLNDPEVRKADYAKAKTISAQQAEDDLFDSMCK